MPIKEKQKILLTWVLLKPLFNERSNKDAPYASNNVEK